MKKQYLLLSILALMISLTSACLGTETNTQICRKCTGIPNTDVAYTTDGGFRFRAAQTDSEGCINVTVSSGTDCSDVVVLVQNVN